MPNGIHAKIAEFRDFLIREKVDVALLCETHLKPCKSANVANYSCYRTDRLNGRGGGTAIYIKRSIDHHQVSNLVDPIIEATIVKINTALGNLHIVSCYNSPNSTLTDADFTNINNLGDKLIIAGDFNSKHLRFNCNTTNSNGRKLIKFADDLNLVIRPPSSATRIPFGDFGRPEILDLVIIKNVVISDEIEVIHDLSSDHLPISFTWGCESDDNESIFKKHIN